MISLRLNSGFYGEHLAVQNTSIGYERFGETQFQNQFQEFWGPQREYYTSHEHPMDIVCRTRYFDWLVSCRGKPDLALEKPDLLVVCSCLVAFLQFAVNYLRNSTENVTRRMAIIRLVIASQELLFLPLIGFLISVIQTAPNSTDTSQIKTPERLGKHF